jgi:hypothetical protein
MSIVKVKAESGFRAGNLAFLYTLSLGNIGCSAERDATTLRRKKE